METVKCKALCAFTLFVPGYGQVHGDPDSKDTKAKNPLVPVSKVYQLIETGQVAAPKGFAFDDDDAPVA